MIFIMADDLGYGDLSCYGATKFQTPNIDVLANEGIRFTDAHSPDSVCTPTRYGVLTGRYIWRGRLKNKVLWSGYEPLLIEKGRKTIGHMMKEMGYHTAQIGKWHLGWGDNDGKTDFAADELPRGPREAFVAAHRAWWKTYYPAGFVPIPHPAMVSFYWIQIYKLGSCIRKGGPMCDLMGPWYKDTRWPAIWWNLNTQMLYSPFPVANRLEMAENLSDMLLKHRANLIANVPDPSQRVGLAATLRGEALRLPRLHRSGTSNAAVTCVTLAGKDETWNY